jgi:ABC-type sugar transport system ATPase subunit
VMREGRLVAEFSREEATQENIGMAMMGNVAGNNDHRQPVEHPQADGV